MERRKLILGAYDTALRGPWTLSALEFPEPDYVSNLIDIPGRDGPLDLSTVLTNGDPVYGGRTLSATLECSEGTYTDREALISEMVNMLDGRRMHIILPDYPLHYAEGRVSVKKEYNDLAHCAVSVTAACDPWRYKIIETRISLPPYFDAAGLEMVAALPNAGRRTVVPTLILSESASKATLTVNGKTWALDEPGTYKMPDLRLSPGATKLVYTVYGDGNDILSIRYREAIL